MNWRRLGGERKKYEFGGVPLGPFVRGRSRRRTVYGREDAFRRTTAVIIDGDFTGAQDDRDDEELHAGYR